jgi:hypothetical protein
MKTATVPTKRKELRPLSDADLNLVRGGDGTPIIITEGAPQPSGPTK